MINMKGADQMRPKTQQQKEMVGWPLGENKKRSRF